MLVYVTSLYAIRDDYLPVLYKHFQQLVPLLRGAPLYVFTDRDIPFSLTDTYANVHVIRRTLTDFQTYRHAMAAMHARLPVQRNAAKDTSEFMALMNTKVEMVWTAAPYFPTTVTHVAWIDAGIMKIVKDAVAMTKVESAFKRHQEVAWPAMKATVPGCWPTPMPPSSDSVCWRFCGGFFVLPTSLLSSFYEAVNAMLDTWLRAGHLVWEVNIWAALEWKEAAWFSWYGADHNETMLEVPTYIS